MKKRFECPSCHAPMEVDPAIDRTAVCSQCGNRISIRAKSAAPVEPADADVENEPGRSGVKPAKRPKEKRRKKNAPSESGKPLWLVAAVGGGVLAAAIVALFMFFRGGDATLLADGDGDVIEPFAPVTEFPSVAWTLRSGPGPNLVFPNLLTVQYEKGFAQVVSLPSRGPEYLSSEGDPGTEELCYGRFDLKTGKPIGPARKLKDLKGGRVGATLLGGTNHNVTPAAVSPKGILAIAITVDKDRLLPIYRPEQDSPKTIPGLTLTGDQAWFDFSADEKLWVISGGKLVAWDLAAGKSAVTANGRFTVPALMGPDRTWLVAQVDDKYLEVLDAATGECRGRFGGEGRWQSVAVSPDGKRLAAARFPGQGFGAGVGAYDFPLDIHEWDLSTGERKAIVSMVRKNNEAKSMHWISADHVLVEEAVVDMKRKMLIASARAKSTHGSQAPGTIREAGWSADGKRWVAVGSNRLAPMPVPLDSIQGEPGFHPGVPVRVEANCGHSALDARVAAALTDALKYYGFRVEDGGWSLRVTATASESGKKLQYAIGSQVAVPEVKGTIELVSPDGAVVEKFALQGQAPMGPGSKYYKGSEAGQIIGQGQTDRYDFGGRSPSDALRQGAWTNFIRKLPTSAWPRAAWKSADKYLPAPLTIEVDPNPKVDG